MQTNRISDNQIISIVVPMYNVKKYLALTDIQIVKQ